MTFETDEVEGATAALASSERTVAVADGALATVSSSAHPPARSDGQTLDSADLRSQSWFAVVRARNTMREVMRSLSRLEPLRLTLRTYTVLSAACEDRGMSQREVADYVMLDERQVVHLIADLERLGFVTREPDERDRRVRVVSATPEGTAVYARAREIIVASQDEGLAKLTRAERLMLVELLNKVSAP